MKKYLIIAGVIALILFSCTPPDQSVYWAIINAVPEVDNSLNNYLTVVAMAGDATNNYMAAGSNIYYRLKTSTSDPWGTLPLPAGTSLCLAMTTVSMPDSCFLMARMACTMRLPRLQPREIGLP
jgi:hypothetical protein